MNNISIGAIVKKQDDYYIVIDYVLINCFDDNMAEILSGDEVGCIFPYSKAESDKYTSYIVPNFVDKLFEANINLGNGIFVVETMENLYKSCMGIQFKFNGDKIIILKKPQYSSNEVIEKEEQQEDNNSLEKDLKSDILNLRHNIKESIVGQDEVLSKVISTIFHNQELFESDLDIEEALQSRQTMLIYGGTGTGKTEIVKQVCERINIPYVIEDATKFTDEAYKARNVSDMLEDLLRAADGDFTLAEHGVLVIDEIDKKSKSEGDSHFSTSAVQNSLLKILDGAVIPIEIQNQTYDFDTSTLTVILCGAFEGLKKNKEKRQIGFNSTEIKNDIKYTTDDFINYGMTPELMGRVTSIVKTNDFSYDALKQILMSSKISPLLLKKRYLDLHNIKLNYDEEFIDMIVKKAEAKKTGARGLKSAVADCFDNLGFNLDFEVLTGEIDELKFEKGIVRKLGPKK